MPTYRIAGKTVRTAEPLTEAQIEEIAADKIVKIERLPFDELDELEAEAAAIFGDASENGIALDDELSDSDAE